jgi:hypothetical protein
MFIALFRMSARGGKGGGFREFILLLIKNRIPVGGIGIKRFAAGVFLGFLRKTVCPHSAIKKRAGSRASARNPARRFRYVEPEKKNQSFIVNGEKGIMDILNTIIEQEG